MTRAPLLALLAAAAIARADATPPTPADGAKRPPVVRPAIPEPVRFVTLDKPRGVIVPAGHGSDFYFQVEPKVESWWTPTRSDIQWLEERLPRLLAGANVRPALIKRFAGFTRQYVGIVTGKQQWIWVNFFCQDFKEDWVHQPILVKDGGECFGRFLYLPSEGKLRDFSTNGSG